MASPAVWLLVSHEVFHPSCSLYPIIIRIISMYLIVVDMVICLSSGLSRVIPRSPSVS
ncbi:hypothetical protein BO71DRAFT_400694 [Aspergillus ellipticus CBS 707.79]|uniref:Uncharacterized protein n=1 Tax=Aspergillus ellipticus CBS 707.79 TaxID=1448320 RepID=A0A319D4X4_9EURO|nr:hypothetical protein BO71DRAFT_400694 [Aspergillus ellipticus CBS 707.79]